jgi:hypothetical protein
LNFGWFVELLIGYYELQLTKIIKPPFAAVDHLEVEISDDRAFIGPYRLSHQLDFWRDDGGKNSRRRSGRSRILCFL